MQIDAATDDDSRRKSVVVSNFGKPKKVLFENIVKLLPTWFTKSQFELRLMTLSSVQNFVKMLLQVEGFLLP